MTAPNRPTIANYDGQNKVNYANLPPANQQTDWQNPLLASCTSDVSEMMQVAPRCWVRLQLAATTGALVVLNWEAMWGNVTETPPIPSRTSAGIYTLTWPTMVSDEYDYSIGTDLNNTLNLSAATCGLESSALFALCNARASGNVITISTATALGSSPADLVGATVFVVGY